MYLQKIALGSKDFLQLVLFTIITKGIECIDCLFTIIS